MKKVCNNLIFTLIFFILGAGWTSCVFDSDKFDEGAYYTFTGETVSSYLEKNQDLFSEFCAILDTTGIVDLLSTYGTFTCFVPTNEALKAYYQDSGKVSYRDFDMQVLKDMVYYQIIDSKVYTSMDFPEGRIVDDKNMKGRFIEISFADLDSTNMIRVNTNAYIVRKDQKVHNGVVHAINSVLVASNYMLPEKIKDKPEFSLFAEALYETHMSDSLLKYKDEQYKKKTVVNSNGTALKVPDSRFYYYTALVESDEVYHRYGIENLEDLIAYAKNVYDKVFPEDADITDLTDRRNSLNRFVSYHLFDYWCDYSSLVVNAKGQRYYTGSSTNMVNYIKTMMAYTRIEDGQVLVGGNALLESSFTESMEIVLNQKSDGSNVPLKGASYTESCVNGRFWELDDLLVYDKDVENDVLNKRLRIDVFSMMPELMNNDIRYGKTPKMCIPNGYIKGLTYNDDETKFQIGVPDGGTQFMGDQAYVVGFYDFTHVIPAVPSNTWELRVSYKPRSDINCIAQLYVDGMPNGIPVDLSVPRDGSYNPAIGWIADLSEDDAASVANNISIDKDMRNLGWMKGPMSMSNGGKCSVQGSNHTHTARCDVGSIRKVVGRYSWQPEDVHTFRIKAVYTAKPSADYFSYDFVEFVPVAMVADEDRY